MSGISRIIVKVVRISGTSTLPGTISLWGQDSSGNKHEEVIYTDARLWSLSDKVKPEATDIALFT